MILLIHSFFISLELRNLGDDINWSLVDNSLPSQVEKPANSIKNFVNWPTGLINWYLTILPAKRAEHFDISPFYNPSHNLPLTDDQIQSMV